MERIINVKIDGIHIKKDSRVAGVQYEGNAATMQFQFDESWKGYAITVTFFDAKGENPTKVLCDLPIDDIPENNNRVSCKIPFAAMAEAGELTFVVEGIALSKDETKKVTAVQRAVSDILEVLPSFETSAGNEESLFDATVAQQIEDKLNRLENEVCVNVQELKAYRDEAKGYASSAARDASTAAAISMDTRVYKDMAEHAQKAIENMGASAQSVPPEEDASVHKNVHADGSIELEFYLPRGKSGVYVGTGEMPDGYNVQVDPSGDASGIYFGTDEEAEGCNIHIGSVLLQAGGSKDAIVQKASTGTQPIASGIGASAFGNGTVASGAYAHAEGGFTEARKAYSHAGGVGTIADALGQYAVGSYNKESNDALFVVGCGTDEKHRANAFEVKLGANGKPIYDFGGVQFTSEMMRKLFDLLGR